MPPQPVPFKPPPRPASIPVAAWAPPAWVEAARSWLFGGNTVVRVGVVVLFFGVAFFLNYAADQGWFPIGLRLSGAALAGLGLLAVGWNLRDSRREYALTLQGGGVGIVYLTAFAAVNVYDLIGVGVGLGVMVVLVVLGAVLAVTRTHGAWRCWPRSADFSAPCWYPVTPATWLSSHTTPRSTPAS